MYCQIAGIYAVFLVVAAYGVQRFLAMLATSFFTVVRGASFSSSACSPERS